MSSPGFPPTRSWIGDETAWPDSALAQGAVRISGAVERDASWHVVTDRLGWTTVVLVGRCDERALKSADVDAVVRACADRCFDPVRVARALTHRFGLWMSEAELGILRVGPHGHLVELLNVSLPAILHYDMHEGVVPYEPLGATEGLNELATTEMVSLEPGALLLAMTEGVLPRSAGWAELHHFVASMGFAHFGGQLADAAPPELARVLRTSVDLGRGPRAVAAIGLMPAELLVA